MTEFTENDEPKKQTTILNDCMIDYIPDSIWTVSKDFCYLALNQTFKHQFLRAFGIEVSVGDPITKGVREELVSFWKPFYEKGLNGEKNQFEYNFDNHFYEVSYSPVWSKDNEVYAVTIVSREITSRKLMETELQTAWGSFSEALSFAKMGYWELDLDTLALYIDKHKQMILEIDDITENSLQIPLSEYHTRFVHPEDSDIIAQSLAILVENKDKLGYSIQVDYRCITAKQKLKYFHLKCEVRANHRIYGFTQDITERKLAQIQSEENQKLYENLVETLPAMVLLHKEGIILFANQTLYNHTGFGKEDVVGKNVLYFVNTDQIEATKERVEKRKKGEYIPDYEVQIPNKWGEMMTLRIKSSEVYINQEKATLIIFQDVSYIQESQNKIKKNNALLRSVINSPTKTIIFSLDTNYCYTSFNDNHKQTMKLIWGCEIEIGANMLDYIKNEVDREKAKNNFDRALMGENFQMIEQYGEAPNRFFYEDAYNPIKDENGNITGLTVFLFDVTALKRTEQALIQSQKEVNLLFEHSFDAVFLVEEKNFKIIRCNRQAVKLFEVENKHEITHNFGFEHLIPENMTYRQIEKAVKDGDIWACEMQYMTAKGRLFWGHLQIKTIPSLEDTAFFMVKITDISNSKETERKFIEKQKQLEAIIENTSDSVWLVDAEYKILMANSAFVNAIYQNHNVMLKPGMCLLTDVPSFPNEELVWWKNWYDEAFSGVSFVRESSFKVNENTFYWENSLHPVRENDEIIGVAITAREITLRKQKEEEIRRSEERLKYAIAATKEGVWDWDIKNKKYVNNAAWYEILELEPSDIDYSTRDISNLIYEADKSQVYMQVWRARRGEIAFFECEYRVKTPKGKTLWVRDRGTVVEKDDKNQATRIVGTLEDITEKKLITLQLEAQQQFIRYVIDAVPSLIFVKDANGRYIMVNKAFANYYNANPQAIIGKTDDDLIPGDNYLPEYHHSDSYVIESGETVYLPETQTIDRSTGEVSFHQTVKLLLTNKDGEKQILGVATNITERKKAEAENVKLLESLMQNVQDLEQFTYMVSHNLRSHVARILGLVAVLDKENKDNPFNDFVFNTIVDEAKHLDAIIGDLNIILSVRNNNDEKREELLLKEICDSVLLSVNADLEKCQGTITFNIDEDLSIYTIKTYAYSIILNLLSNAIKYRHPDRKPHIEVKAGLIFVENKQFICLSVQDNGLGIDLVKNKGKVFGLYRRFHSHVDGKGIGLHITKTQIERMGGKIEIQSELNVGTTFLVYFPV